MDTNDIYPDIDRLAKGLTSLDRVEYDAAINAYFEANAVIDNERWLLRGSSRIKKWTYLWASLAKESTLVSKPEYDDQTQQIKLAIRRVFALPEIPQWVPILAPYSKAEREVFATVDLYLSPDGDDTGNGQSKLYVTKLGKVTRDPLPYESFIPYAFLRVLSGYIALAIATVMLFVERYPPSQGLIRMFFAALYESAEAVWVWVSAQRATRQARAERWRSSREAELFELVRVAQASAGDLQVELEKRAKEAGVPVEAYKEQTMKMLNELQVKAADMLQAFDANRERVKEAVAQLKPKVQQVLFAHEYEHTSSGTTVNDSGSESGEQHSQHEHAHGHDNHESSTATEDGSEVDEHDRPQTPLGGTDPTAPNAPSYADMAHQ